MLCPNCSYDLVLLSNRRKYKCAKCGKLFLQKRTEFQNFQRWNGKQREFDLHNFNLELKHRKEQRRKILTESRILRGFRLLFKDKSGDSKKRIEHYERNKEKLIAKTLEWKKRNRDKINQKNRENRHKSLETIRQRDRLSKWRERHKLMALQHLKINGYNPYDIGLDDSFSTFGLAHLLSFSRWESGK